MFYEAVEGFDRLSGFPEILLVERGLLNLEDKVAKYLPEYECLTVRDKDI